MPPTNLPACYPAVRPGADGRAEHGDFVRPDRGAVRCHLQGASMLQWRDVLVGAAVTSLLFVIGKSLISWYLGSSAVGSAYGAAGALIVLLFWVYYSVQIFLLGAGFTKVYASRHGSKQSSPVPVRGRGRLRTQ